MNTINAEQDDLKNYTISILIPSASVGYIIGKNGASFKAICASSDAFFFIQQADDVPPDSNERIAIVTGGLQSVLRTAQLLFDKLRDCSTPSTVGADSKSTHVIVRWLIPSNLCGVLIGRGGSRIIEINQKSGAYVKVAHLDETCKWKDERLVYFRGDSVSVELALTLVKTLVGGRLASDLTNNDSDSSNTNIVNVPICGIYAALFGEFRTDQVSITKLHQVFTEEGIQIANALVKPDTNIIISATTLSVAITGSKANVDEACNIIHNRIAKWTFENTRFTLPNGDVFPSGHEFSVKIAIKSVYAVEYVRQVISSDGTLFDQIYQITGAFPLLLPTKSSNSLSSETSSLMFFGCSIHVVLQGIKHFLVSTRGIPNPIDTNAQVDVIERNTLEERSRDNQGIGWGNPGARYMQRQPHIPLNIQYSAHQSPNTGVQYMPPPNSTGQYLFIPTSYFPTHMLYNSHAFDMQQQSPLENPANYSTSPMYYPSSPLKRTYK